MTPPYDWIGMSGKVEEVNNYAGHYHPHPAINHQASFDPGLVVKNWMGFLPLNQRESYRERRGRNIVNCYLCRANQFWIHVWRITYPQKIIIKIVFMIIF